MADSSRLARPRPIPEATRQGRPQDPGLPFIGLCPSAQADRRHGSRRIKSIRSPGFAGNGEAMPSSNTHHRIKRARSDQFKLPFLLERPREHEMFSRILDADKVSGIASLRSPGEAFPGNDQGLGNFLR